MRSEDGIFQVVRKIAADKLEMSEEEITLESSFRNDLHISSIVIIAIILAIETEFGIEIADEEIVSIDTIGDAVRFVVGKLGTTG
ncbi:MAG: acyl carrier protein [bacterium]